MKPNYRLKLTARLILAEHPQLNLGVRRVSGEHYLSTLSRDVGEGKRMNYRAHILAVIVFFLYGCSHAPYYVEPVHNTEGMATIEGSTKYYLFAWLRTIPGSIDNGTIRYNFSKVDITPGHHDIKILYSSGSTWVTNHILYAVPIVAESNHHYVIRGKFWGKQRAWVEDLDDPKIRWEAIEE